MRDKKRKIINWILNILLIVLLIIGIYLFATRILGHSPTDFQLIIWLLGFFATAVLKVFSLVYNLNRELGEIKIQMINSFKKVREDISKLENIKKR